MLRRSALALLSAAVVSTALAPLPAAATADSTIDVGLEGFRDIVVAQSHDRVFISQGTDEVVVTDLAGTRTDVLQGLTGAWGMTLAEDEGTLFVAMHGGEAIGVVDTETLAVGTIGTGAGTCPMHLATTAQMVWFADSCDTGTVREGTIGALDPVEGTVHPDLAEVYATAIAASPARPGELFVGTRTSLLSLTALGGESPSLTQRLEHSTQVGAWDAAVTPDGSRVVTNGGSGRALALTTGDFTPAASYAFTGGASPVSLAIRGDGMLAIGTYDDEVHVVPPGGEEPLRSYDFSRGYSHSVAFGETSMYVVAGRDPELHVITPRRASKLTVKRTQRKVDHGAEATVRVRLDGGETSREVQVYAQPAGEPAVLVATGEVPVDGWFVARHRITRTTTFLATYAGDDSYDTATGKTHPVGARADLRTKMLRPSGMAGRQHLYRVNKRAVLRATLLPRGLDRCIVLRLQYYFRGRWGHEAKTDCLPVDRRSRVKGFVAGDRQLVGIPMRLRAEFRGDQRNARTKTAWSYAKFTR